MSNDDYISVPPKNKRSLECVEKGTIAGLRAEIERLRAELLAKDKAYVREMAKAVARLAEIERLTTWNAKLREALDLIWHIAPLPTQTEHTRLERIHEIARNARRK